MKYHLNNGLTQLQSGKSYFSKAYTTTANIAASGTSAERFISEDDEWSDAPFDTMLISNNDAVELSIQLDYNPDNTIDIPALTSLGVTELNFRNYNIVNRDSATAHTAGKIRILVQNTKRPRRQ